MHAPNVYRLSGLLWQYDPLRVADSDDVWSDAYDALALEMIQHADTIASNSDDFEPLMLAWCRQRGLSNAVIVAALASNLIVMFANN